MLHRIKRLYNKYKSNPKKVRVVGDFFVVEPSVWPFLTAMGIFLLVLSTVAFFSLCHFWAVFFIEFICDLNRDSYSLVERFDCGDFEFSYIYRVDSKQFEIRYDFVYF